MENMRFLMINSVSSASSGNISSRVGCNRNIISLEVVAVVMQEQ